MVPQSPDRRFGNHWKAEKKHIARSTCPGNGPTLKEGIPGPEIQITGHAKIPHLFVLDN